MQIRFFYALRKNNILFQLFAKDCYSDSKGRTKADEEQNVKLIALHQKGNRTILEFERKFVTCDDRDYDIEVK